MEKRLFINRECNESSSQEKRTEEQKPTEGEKQEKTRKVPIDMLLPEQETLNKLFPYGQEYAKFWVLQASLMAGQHLAERQGEDIALMTANAVRLMEMIRSNKGMTDMMNIQICAAHQLAMSAMNRLESADNQVKRESECGIAVKMLRICGQLAELKLRYEHAKPNVVTVINPENNQHEDNKVAG